MLGREGFVAANVSAVTHLPAGADDGTTTTEPTDSTDAGRSRVIRPGWALAIAAWAIYTFGMAMAWLVTDNSYDDTAEVLRDMWWVLAILIVIMFALVRLSGLRVHRSWRLGWPSLLLIVPVAISLVGVVVPITEPGTEWTLVWVALFGTLLVGIGEETAFRGIVLNSIATRTSVVVAVLASGVLFGLMHSVNAMIAPVGDTVTQVIVTSVTGITFGVIYVASGGNLVLVICLHWLYDFALIGPLATTAGENTMGVVAPFFLLANVAALVILFVRYRGLRWPEMAKKASPAEQPAPGQPTT